MVLFCTLLLGAFVAVSFLKPSGPFPPGGVFVEIPPGASLRAVSRILASKGVVRSALAFELSARSLGRPLQAGEYQFDSPEPLGRVLWAISNGKVYQVSFTVPEGLTMFQVADRFAAAGFGTREQFLEAAGDPLLVRDLAPEARNLEGFLFPATYYLARRTTAMQLAEKMVAQFRAQWEEVSRLRQPEKAPPALSLHELVTLASLVERETPAPGERPVIAAVFYNRLNKRIALQCDPTVLYAMELAGKNDGVIHQSDLRLKSPYNTYLYRGLPPGPIGNPGRAALIAARHPQPVKYLYFVADTQGGHLFSETLAEHTRNVARYRRLLSQQRNGAAPPGNGARRLQ